MTGTSDPLRIHVDRNTGLEDDQIFREQLALRTDLASVTYGAVTYGEADSPFTLLISTRPDVESLASSPELRMLLVPVAGVPEATWRTLTNFPHIAVYTSHFNAQPTAEMAFSLMLSAAKGIVTADSRMREQDWTPRFTPPSSILLFGKNTLVIGFGAVGRRISQFCRGIGMNVNAIRRSTVESYIDEQVHVHPTTSLRNLLPTTDVVFIAAPLNGQTKGLLDASQLALLGPETILVNVARPEIVDESGLYEALRTNRIGAAALDIWWQEPSTRAEAVGFQSSLLPFHELPNVVLSPHRAGGAGLPVVKKLRAAAIVQFVEAVAAGQPLPHREHPVYQ